MSANLDLIATVDISLDTPISNDANFDNILILGPAPATPTGEVPSVGVYRSLEELTELGFTATGDGADPVGVAARVALALVRAPLVDERHARAFAGHRFPVFFPSHWRIPHRECPAD